MNARLALLRMLPGALILCALAAPAAVPAEYHGLEPDRFLKSWLVLRPISIAGNDKERRDEAIQKKAMAQDWLAAAGGESNIHPHPGMKIKAGSGELEWEPIDSPNDLVDLTAGKSSDNFAIAYAFAEIDLPESTKGILAFGSDDALEVWLNGKPLLKHFVARATRPDDDLVPVEFVRGKNQLLLKILNLEQDWGFCCRLLSPQSQAQKLTGIIRAGAPVEDVRHLLDRGLAVNSRDRAGLTPLLAARLRGDSEMVEFLKSRGAEASVPMPPRDGVADALLSSLVSTNAAGLAVLVAQDGKILFNRAYGLADFKRGVAATSQTKFRIGSVTKQFTASAILKLQEQGKLSTQDKLSKYLPGFPRGDEVTLHHLLTHTSGIHSYTSKPRFMDTVATPVKTMDLINSFKDDPYDFNPGQRWLYDNSGYLLLGWIIENVSGMEYGEFLRRQFFEPLGMTNTGVHRSDIALEHEALGYEFGPNGKFTLALNWDMSRAGGAGSLYSTVEDLYRWNEAVFSGKVLKEASLKAAFTPVKTEENKTDSSDSGYGYGWGISRMRGAAEISHSGGLNGFSSFLLRLPEQTFTVVVLANALPGAPGAETGRLAHELAEVYLGDKLGLRPAPKANPLVDAKSFDALAGRYDYSGAIMTFTREGGHLFAQLADQPRFEIFPKSETEFFWKVVEAEVTFVKDDTGKVTTAIHHQNGNTIRAPRLEEARETQVDAAALEPLLGKYDYGQGQAIMTVTREGRRLFAQLTGQPKYEIFPKSPTEFFWKIVDARIRFVKDASGKVTRAIHHQGGQDLEAPRID